MEKIYLLKGENTPPVVTIQAKHTRRKPLLWFDEEQGGVRELRYATNMASPFVDEQKGNATLAHIVFLDGVLEVPRQQQSLQKLLSLYHPKAGELWEEIDEEVIAKDEVDNIEFEFKESKKQVKKIALFRLDELFTK